MRPNRSACALSISEYCARSVIIIIIIQLVIDERKNAMTNPHETNETNIPEANYSVRVPESRKRQQNKKNAKKSNKLRWSSMELPRKRTRDVDTRSALWSHENDDDAPLDSTRHYTTRRARPNVERTTYSRKKNHTVGTFRTKNGQWPLSSCSSKLLEKNNEIIGDETNSTRAPAFLLAEQLDELSPCLWPISSVFEFPVPNETNASGKKPVPPDNQKPAVELR